MLALVINGCDLPELSPDRPAPKEIVLEEDKRLIEQISSILQYKAEDGTLLWKKSLSSRVKPGTVAGCINRNGYVQLHIFGKYFAAHRVIWAINYGEWPKHQIDHIDGVKHNNRIENLRDIPAFANTQNQRKAKSSNISCGLLGVTKNKDKWQAQIKAQGIRKHIGTFATAHEAHRAYVEAKRQLHSSCSI